jgi:hypothetical protein
MYIVQYLSHATTLGNQKVNKCYYLKRKQKEYVYMYTYISGQRKEKNRRNANIGVTNCLSHRNVFHKIQYCKLLL